MWRCQDAGIVQSMCLHAEQPSRNRRREEKTPTTSNNTPSRRLPQWACQTSMKRKKKTFTHTTLMSYLPQSHRPAVHTRTDPSATIFSVKTTGERWKRPEKKEGEQHGSGSGPTSMHMRRKVRHNLAAFCYCKSQPWHRANRTLMEVNRGDEGKEEPVMRPSECGGSIPKLEEDRLHARWRNRTGEEERERERLRVQFTPLNRRC